MGEVEEIAQSRLAKKMTDAVWWVDTHINANERRAVQEAFAGRVVALFLDNGRSLGTGTLIRWQRGQYILTAGHNLSDQNLHAIRYFTRPSGPLVETTPEIAFRQHGPARISGYSLDVAGIVAQTKERQSDLAVLQLASCCNIDAGASFYELREAPIELTDGVSIFTLGYAASNSLEFAPGRRGVVQTGDIANFSSTLNGRTDLHSSYDPQQHFLLPFTRIEDGLEPHGISGAGAWCNVNPIGQLWAAAPLLVGVVTRWHRKQNLLQITRIKPIIELFKQLH